MPNCKPTKLEEKFRIGMKVTIYNILIQYNILSQHLSNNDDSEAVLKQRLKQIARLKTHSSLNQKQVEAIQKERTWVDEL